MSKPELDRRIAELVDKVIKDRTLAKYLKSDAARTRKGMENATPAQSAAEEEDWDNMPV